MAKRVVWTNTAKKSRQEILEYWAVRNKSKTYPRKLSLLFTEKVNLIKSENYVGKPTNFDAVRATLVSHFTIFYKLTIDEIIIVGIWDNRRNPDDLRKSLEY
jgi:hypothetical protein